MLGGWVEEVALVCWHVCARGVNKCQAAVACIHPHDL